MNTAKNRVAVCVHGVNVILDKGHSCFECEKQALANGMPIELRMLDGTNAMLLHAHLGEVERSKSNGHTAPAARVVPEKAAEDIFTPHAGPSRGMGDVHINGTAWTGEALSRLIDDLRRPRDINGDALPPKAAAIPEAGEVKALQRALIDMRRELTEAVADRDLFAAENHDLIRAVDDLKARMVWIANFAKPITYAA